MYRLNDEQNALVERVRKIAEDTIAPNAKDVDAKSRFPQEAISALGAEGFMGLNVPKEYGGMGEGLRTSTAVLDEIAQRCASTGMVYLMHLCGVACYAANPNAASDELGKAAKGEHLSTLAWSEKGSRSHFWAPTSQAQQNNGQVSLSAEKSFVTSAGIADGYVVSTRTAGGDGPTAYRIWVSSEIGIGLPAWSARASRAALASRSEMTRPVSSTESPA